MKTLGVILIVVSMVLGFIANIPPYSNCFEAVVIIACLCFLSGVWAIVIDCTAVEEGMPKHQNPDDGSEPLIQCHKLSFENSDKAMAVLKLLKQKIKDTAAPKKGKCYKDCGDTQPFPMGNGSICLNCGSSIVKDKELEFLFLEFPKDRIKQKLINGFYESDISKFENTYGGA